MLMDRVVKYFLKKISKTPIIIKLSDTGYDIYIYARERPEEE